MNRRKLRDYTFKCIFHTSFYNREDLPGQMELFLQDTDIPEDANEPDEADTADGRTAVPEAKTAAPAPAPLTEKEQQAVLQRAEDVLSHLDEIDRMITEKTEGWSPERMNQVDLSIIRLALYEMHFDSDVPEGVAINEAVNLARKYGGDSSPKFVNGVLARFVTGENGGEA